jgi:Carboxypeptidase regulatory-like domain/Oxidoreductase molybdopterin binding domain
VPFSANQNGTLEGLGHHPYSRYARRMHRLISAVAILCLLSLPALAFPAAQTGLAHILVSAQDSTGKPVWNAQIQLTPAPNPLPKNMETNEQGTLALNLKPGTYRLNATRVGYFDFATQIVVKPSSDPQNFVIHFKQAPSAHVRESAAPIRHTLRVSAGSYHQDVSYTLADLKSMPHTFVTIHSPHSDTGETYSGVRLADILRPLGVPLDKDFRSQALTVCLVATGSDGYRVTLSLAEADPTFHPGEVIVADSYGGEPLGEASGPFRLLVSEDKRPARSVKNLVSIELKSVK